MTKNLLVLLGLASLPLLGGCTGEPDDTDTTDDTGTEPDDTGTEPSIEAPFTVELPEGMLGAVSIFKDENGGTGAEVGNCAIGAETCSFTASAAGTYWVLVDADTAIFLAKTVVADEDGAFPDIVSWNTGGCGDEGWTPESHAACASWVPGEWGLAPNGDYRWDEDGGTVEIVTDNSPDVTHDGLPDIVIAFGQMAEAWPVMTVAGNQFYGTENQVVIGGTISDDVSVVRLYAYLGGENTDDSIFEQ